ncbi:MAG: Type 1 glutamine amidotransferase-like domain-containing protein [Chloroflexota bacterium]
MSGPIALHGGGEFLPGDEAFLTALLERARGRRKADRARPIRVAIVPTAAARGRPDLAAANGVGAFERVAADGGFEIEASAVEVVDRATAADPELTARLAVADVIHFPGGDPDLIPSLMPGSPAWAAVLRAHAEGAVLAGASAGAMALGPWTWTPGGGVAGLRVVHGIVVVPHARAADWSATIDRFAAWAPEGLSPLGLAEQTGVIQEPMRPGRATVKWRVIGPGEALWLPSIGGRTTVASSGEVISTPFVPV